MCIVIDTNCLSNVFDETSSKHTEFKPVFDWIYNGKGRIVFGGTKYSKEMGRYLNLFAQLSNVNKTVYIDDAKVDRQEVEVSKRLTHKNFDDQHLVGLLLESKCKLICSLDERAYGFFTHSEFFKSSKRPKIYKSSRNHALLVDVNIAEVCKPCKVTTNAQKKILKSILSTVKK